MANTTRQTVAGLVMICLAGVARPAAAAENQPEINRVRSSNPSIAALIANAANRSKTFGRLVAAINATDGIVYIEEGKCKHVVPACFVAIKTAGPNRLLWVKINIQKAEWDLMGSIAHELRHTLEVLGERGVTNAVSMYMFYSRLGLTGTEGTFETPEAIEVGHAVRDEILTYRSSVSVPQ